MFNVEGATFDQDGSPPITRIAFPACHAHYPGGPDKREFVQVLRLMEVFPLDDVAAAARDAIARGAIGFDAVKHLILCHIERRPPRLDMTVYPYLPRAQVTMTSARTYMSLLTGVSS